MDFNFVREPVVWWPVRVSLPSPKGDGSLVEMTFRAGFEVISKPDLRAMIAKHRDRAARLAGELDTIAAGLATDPDADHRAIATQRQTEIVGESMYLDDDHQRAILERAWVDWADIRDGEGEAAPVIDYTPELRGRMLALKPIHDAVWRAWSEAMAPEARAGNSARPAERGDTASPAA